MKVAFYASLKPPDHPTPSGDRLMARLLIQALQTAGCEVRLASDLRTYTAQADHETLVRLKTASRDEAERLVAAWSSPDTTWTPDVWFTYHPYYKAPDWIGPQVSARLHIPYLTAEASYAGKRDAGPWRPWQRDVVSAVRAASANFCMTAVDRAGLERLQPLAGPLIDLPPFIDPPPLDAPRRHCAVPRIATVAMMRSGSKLESYRLLAEALVGLRDVPWRLAVMGDGPARADVLAAFATLPADRIDWLGQVDADTVVAELAACDLYVWPGIQEAYGLAYLEAQAMGLPVVAFDSGGVSAVVEHGTGGWLTPAGDVKAFADAVRRMLLEHTTRIDMGDAARRFVRERRSVASAAAILHNTISGLRTSPARTNFQ